MSKVMPFGLSTYTVEHANEKVMDTGTSTYSVKPFFEEVNRKNSSPVEYSLRNSINKTLPE